MTRASDNVFPKVKLSTVVASTAPTGGEWRLETRANGLFAVSSNTGSAGTGPLGAGGSGSVATDAIWDAAGDLAVGSGADTAARLAIGAAGGALSRVNGAVAWNSGTSFPTAATGDRYWRTDRGLEYYYDGTRWLTVAEYSLALRPTDELVPIATSGRRIRMAVPYKGTYSLYLQKLWVSYLNAGTNDGSNFWTGTLYWHDSADSTTSLGSAFNSSAAATSTWIAATVTVDAVLSTSAFAFSVQMVKTAAPGTLYIMGELFYRLVG